MRKQIKHYLTLLYINKWSYNEFQKHMAQFINISYNAMKRTVKMTRILKCILYIEVCMTRKSRG